MNGKATRQHEHLSLVSSGQGCSGVRAQYARLMHKVAHELRSPLTVIQMQAEALAAMQQADSGRRAAAIVVEQARQIGRLLEDALTLFDGEIDTGRPALVDINMAALEASRELTRLANQRRANLQVGQMKLGAVVEGNAAALGRALRACIQSMLLACTEGSSLVVEVIDQDGVEGKIASDIAVVVRRQDVATEGESPAAVGWDRLPLEAATQIVTQHGGTIEPLPPEEGYGIRVRMPRYRQAGEALGETSVAEDEQPRQIAV